MPPVVPRPPEIEQRMQFLSERERSNLQVFDAVWSLVSRKFYDAKFHGADWPRAALAYAPKAASAANDEELYGVLNQMLGELKESHNWASSPADVAARVSPPQTRVGVALAHIEQRWIVAAVLPNSPAAEAGVKRGWVLATRNGHPFDDVVKVTLREGETVEDVFLDEDERPHPLKLTARLLQFDLWREARELAPGIWYLRFDGFDAASRRWLSQQLKRHRDARAVVLDLRQNSGGSAFSLEIVLGEFFSKSVAWGRFIRRSGSRYNGSTWQWGSARYEGKVAVLVGGNSASCAEIFAQVLQAQKRAVIVGSKTAGAVLGSYEYRLPDGGRLQLSVFDYQDPEGDRLEGVGVVPDIVVNARYEDVAGLRADHDLEIEAAVAAVTDGQRAAVPQPEVLP